MNTYSDIRTSMNKRTQAKTAVETLKILSSKTRFRIVSLLLNAGTGDDTPCVNEIADDIGISHSATSHQLARLEDKGVVESFRKGQTICYTVKENATTKRLRRIINEFGAE